MVTGAMPGGQFLARRLSMLSRMISDALHATDSGEGGGILPAFSGAAPYRVASLMSHKRSQ